MNSHEIASLCRWLIKLPSGTAFTAQHNIHHLVAVHPELLDKFPCDWDRFLTMIGEQIMWEYQRKKYVSVPINTAARITIDRLQKKIKQCEYEIAKLSKDFKDQ